MKNIYEIFMTGNEEVCKVKSLVYPAVYYEDGFSLDLNFIVSNEFELVSLYGFLHKYLLRAS